MNLFMLSEVQPNFSGGAEYSIATGSAITSNVKKHTLKTRQAIKIPLNSP
jgi:hypothetical protein